MQGMLIAAALANRQGAQIELLPGQQRMWEESKKDVLGQVEYIYYCKEIPRTGPISENKQSSACSLEQ